VASTATELLIRRVMQRSMAAIFYLENGYFYPSGRSGGADSQGDIFGGWTFHKPVLHHYGVPAVVLGLGLEAERARIGLPLESPTEDARSSSSSSGHVQHPLSRRVLMADRIHLSSRGHQFAAFCVAQALRLELLKFRARLAPPEPLYVSTGDGAPLTMIDFTAPTGKFKGSISHVRGWAWRIQRKHSGGYVTRNMTTRTSLDHMTDKVGFVATRAESSFTAPMRFARGVLRVGFLRSWDYNIGAIELSIPKQPACVLNGTWEMQFSIYDQQECTFGSIAHSRATASLKPDPRAASEHRVMIRLLPPLGENRFTLYTLLSF
jgi:hypothetical protein